MARRKKRTRHSWDAETIQDLVTRVSTAARGEANTIYQEFADRIGGGMKLEAVRQQYYLHRDETAIANKAQVAARQLQLREAQRLADRAATIADRIESLRQERKEVQQQAKLALKHAKELA
jgi:hypothetical protein